MAKKNTTVVAESNLPEELDAFQAVTAAYVTELSSCYGALRRQLGALIECEKELAPYIYRALRDRLRENDVRCIYVDGRPSADLPPGPPGVGLVGTMIHQIRELVRGAAGERVIVLPHLDMIGVMSNGALNSESRELIPLLYENPEILWLGFKDPSVSLPEPIQKLFPHHEQFIGIPRDRLQYLITKGEARKFGKTFDPYQIYKHVSGMNAVRLRRVLSSLDGEDFPENNSRVIAQLRTATLSSDVELPNLDLDKDIGGYKSTKERLKSEILTIMSAKDKLTDPTKIKQMEGLLPRGMIFEGSPGCGKTMFAKAMATALGASIQIVSGPELKSKWVGESEQNLREVFMRARQSAPSIIVFDEIDSFAVARGSYTGSGVEHSMVNQLLTEMDGFRKEELVFVVGTTNFAESLDNALLRPGRFELVINIPYPNSDDRREIIKVWDNKMGLGMTEAALEYAIKRTGDPVPGGRGGSHYSGDHIQALCRQIARTRLREDIDRPTEPADIDNALEKYMDLPKLTSEEEKVVASHEAGHAITGLNMPNGRPIDRISIRGDIGGALGYVQHADPAHKYITTHAQLLDMICTMFGGREAEQLLFDGVSVGAASDLHNASAIARGLIQNYGHEIAGLSVGEWAPDKDRITDMSDATKDKIDAAVARILEEQRERCRKILIEKKDQLIALRDLLLEKKSLDKTAFSHLSAKK